MKSGRAAVAVVVATLTLGAPARARGVHREEILVDARTGAIRPASSQAPQSDGPALVNLCLPTASWRTAVVDGPVIRATAIPGAQPFALTLAGDRRNRLNWLFVRRDLFVASVATFPTPDAGSSPVYATLGVSTTTGRLLWRSPDAPGDSRCWDLDGTMVISDFRSLTPVDPATGAAQAPPVNVPSGYDPPVRIAPDQLLLYGHEIALVDTRRWRLVWRVDEHSLGPPLAFGPAVYSLVERRNVRAAAVDLVVRDRADGREMRRITVARTATFYDTVSGRLAASTTGEVRVMLDFIVLD